MATVLPASFSGRRTRVRCGVCNAYTAHALSRIVTAAGSQFACRNCERLERSRGISQDVSASRARVIRGLPPTIHHIQSLVCRRFKLPAALLLSASRKAEFAIARQVGMYVARKLTSRSLQEIAREFGRTDHTTALHAVEHIERRRATNPQVDADVRAILRELVA